MTFPNDPNERSPKGDHNRRLSLGMERADFALHASISDEQLRKYESTPPDGEFDVSVAQLVGETLERLEANRVPKVDNGDAPVTVETDGELPITPDDRAVYKAPTPTDRLD